MSAPPAIDHYENFPVASWLCPARWRASVAALYHFARTADDLADEGSLSPEQRLEHLGAYRQDLQRAQGGKDPQSCWAATIETMAAHTRHHQLDWTELYRLLDAFEQDVRYTAEQRRYADMPELLAYCRNSASPVGRLMLQIMGQSTPQNLQASDDICTALQLINFWQDLGLDLSRQRHYIPQSTWSALGLPKHTDIRQVPAQVATEVVEGLVNQARERMVRGAWLPTQVPGRMGWELRGVVLGGLRITERIQSLGYATWRVRPVLGGLDPLKLTWRALKYRAFVGD